MYQIRGTLHATGRGPRAMSIFDRRNGHGRTAGRKGSMSWITRTPAPLKQRAFAYTLRAPTLEFFPSVICLGPEGTVQTGG